MRNTGKWRLMDRTSLKDTQKKIRNVDQGSDEARQAARLHCEAEGKRLEQQEKVRQK